ncbi:MAG: peptidase MA family metallohydrolase [Candidatus Poribacteria bacterium]|nr:peptidase MA family metallohydrolase [Candidatus Poribacteria bacterium]
MAKTRVIGRVLVAIWLICLPLIVFAQRPMDGWNAVERFPIRVYHVDQAMEANRVLTIAETLYRDIDAKFRLPDNRLIQIYLADSPSSFQQLSDAPIQDWAQGYAFPTQGIIALLNPTGSGRLERLDEVTRHEVAHVCLGFLSGEAHESIPTWFHEGFAMYVSERWDLMHQARLLTAELLRRFIPLEELDGAFPAEGSAAQLAYSESFSAVRSLVFDHSFSQLRTLLHRLNEGEPFEDAFTKTFGVTTPMFALDWRDSATSGFQWVGIVGGLIAVGAVFTPIFLYGHARRIRQRRRRLDEWAEEEAKPDSFFRAG